MFAQRCQQVRTKAQQVRTTGAHAVSFSIKGHQGRLVRHMPSQATPADGPGNSSALDATSLATSQVVPRYALERERVRPDQPQPPAYTRPVLDPPRRA